MSDSFPSAVVLDTNLSILLIVGMTDARLIAAHKRLGAYSAGDFDLLRRVLAPVQRIVVTPNTLTEVSNLLGQIGEPARSRLFETFAGWIRLSDERTVPSAAVSANKVFVRLGLTDAVVLEVLDRDHEIALLTADLDLYLAALRAGRRAENFNHIRDALFG